MVLPFEAGGQQADYLKYCYLLFKNLYLKIC